MSNSSSKWSLPERASLEYLKKRAKDRLRDLRQADPKAKLAAALLAVAREHGFPSWRALKAEVDQRQQENVALFFEVCVKGDVPTLRTLLANDPSLARADNPEGRYRGWTGLHSAAQHGHAEAVRLLLDHGSDPNAREAGDNTYPLHWAAAHGHVEVARKLLDAGGDVHGFGDVHQLDVIGWATVFHGPDRETADVPQEIVWVLLDRGARHHIFSAIAVGDLELIQKLVEEDPAALDRRMSRFEQGQTALHFAIHRKRYDILDLLIELGADLEAEDMHGRTALSVVMLSGDQEAMRRLHAAGAKPPKPMRTSDYAAKLAKVGETVKRCIPMIFVPDVAKALDWYVSIGFKEIARYGEDDLVNFGVVSMGNAEVLLNMHGKAGRQSASLWFYTDEVDNLYQLLKSRQLESAQAVLAGEPGEHEGVEFVEDINNPFYGGREFGIRDLNGYELYFRYQPEG